MTNQTGKNDAADRTVRDMAGYIARNERRNNERQPAWRGKVTIKGKEYLLSLWEKSPDLLSLAVTDPDDMPPRPDQGTSGGSAGNAGSGAPSGKADGGYPSSQAKPPVGGDPFGDIFNP